MTIHPDDWEALLSSTEHLRDELRRSRAQFVGAQRLQEDARSIAEWYFRDFRQPLLNLGCSGDQIEKVDDAAQRLLRLSRSRNRRTSYLAQVTRIREALHELDVQRHRLAGETQFEAPRVLSRDESLILETLTELIPSAALSYEQVIKDLEEPERVSYRGSANELREALREILDHLAPDEAVVADPTFEPEGDQSRPTQRQKVRHVLRSRGRRRNEIKVPEDAINLIEELTATLTRSIYQRGNISAHVESSRRELQQMKRYVDSVLAELLEIHP